MATTAPLRPLTRSNRRASRRGEALDRSQGPLVPEEAARLRPRLPTAPARASLPCNLGTSRVSRQAHPSRESTFGNRDSCSERRWSFTTPLAQRLLADLGK